MTADSGNVTGDSGEGDRVDSGNVTADSGERDRYERSWKSARRYTPSERCCA
ncbi:hypothetical protein [Candidatus Symbiobacter mobilis]|uniref:hypothetical protein n=1 Tax=Candidatus Symbiobacter mobilis TaxID=1436290 RepID=UPI0016510915|nr:hypothetical protein [Candidatus Symbiobacter mobilis]